ncbi:MAG: peptidoglycan DD-metalloendopeptidase family protein [Bauldia sp.]
MATLIAVALLACASPGRAAEGDPAPTGLDARQAELDAITHDIELTRERQAEIRQEIEALDKDRTTLNQSLIDASREVQKLEGTLDRSERRLRALFASEDKLRASLAERRGVLAEVLAALQRMGHRPPPAILVRPEDALSAVRSAILLGALVPELRDLADQLAADLGQLTTVRSEQERERDRLGADATALIEGRARIAFLLDEKKRQRALSVEALASEESRAAALAEQATTLKELIARMESEDAVAAAASAKAEQAAAIARREGGGRPANSLGSADRLAPAVAFADAKGLLPLPANGTVVKVFGESDGLGSKAQGMTMATRPGGRIASPADGWVVYGGSFRSYGQLLIINAGDGYHVLLAGMERIDVELGQFVLAGEPVAVMASRRLASVGAVDVGVSQPTLYIEFRKDGISIDPAPWWAASNAEKVGG